MDKSSQVKARHPSVLCCVGWIDGCIGVTTTTTTFVVVVVVVVEVCVRTTILCAQSHKHTLLVCLFVCFHVNILCLSRKEHVPQGRTNFFSLFFYPFFNNIFKINLNLNLNFIIIILIIF
jgi:hypothetical protein